MTLITKATAEAARLFFLKHSSYCKFSLPIYFDFEPLLSSIQTALRTKQNGINDIGYKKACDYENVNYTLQTNKDGQYSWRPFELIHPAIYVHLVEKITEEENWKLLVDRFDKFKRNERIVCASIPRESENDKISDSAKTVTGWWINVEQESINQSLNFKYLFTTDIANFYPSIYTHSIPWAIHTKDIAKGIGRSDKKLLGNQIDLALRQMSWGQTNGIPQGSALMDFISEIVLGYADEILGDKLDTENITDYKIIRFRDDYRVFTNNKEDSEAIARHLTVILQELGLQLNASKTSLSEDIILDSMKQDKKDALMTFGSTITATTIQKALLKLTIFSRKHKNSGQLDKYLAKLNIRLERMSELKEEVQPIVSIITDLMINNPRTFASCALVLSNVLEFLEDDSEKIKIIESIKLKFNHILGTGILDIWLQRISYHIKQDIEYEEVLCSIVSGLHNKPHELVWNSEWITDENFKTNVMNTNFINNDELRKCKPIISDREVVLFPYGADFNDEEDE